MRIVPPTRRFHGVQFSLDYIPYSQIPGETEGSWETPQTESTSIGRSTDRYPGFDLQPVDSVDM